MGLITRPLSDREKTVLLLAADGLTDKEIAKYLQLSQRTIGTYWERMREKLGHFSRTQLVANFVRGSAQSESSASYRSLFASWEEGIWILLSDGTTVYANRLIADLFDLTVEDFQNTNAKELIEKVASVPIDNLFDVSRNKEQSLEFKIQKKNGTVLWLSMAASLVSTAHAASNAIVLRVSDISVQRRVKHTLDSCESSLSFLSEHSSDLIARFDRNLTCTAANRSLQSDLSTMIVGKKVTEIPEILKPNELWVNTIRQALETGETQCFECVCPHCDNPTVTYLLPLPAEKPGTVEVMSITRPLPE